MTRDEIEEMIRHSIDDAAIHRKFDAGVEQAASNIYDKLVLGGVIPAEGTVVVDANVANKIVRMWDARANLKAMQLKNARRMATSQSACDEVNRAGFSWQAAWEAITDDDINAFRAIPDAPTGEGER